MKIVAYSVLGIFAFCYFGCSEKKQKDTVLFYVNKHGIPHLAAESIEINKKESGLRVAVVERALDQITNSKSSDTLKSVQLLYAKTGELQWAINNYYRERSNNTVDGMYYPTRSWSGESVTIINVDSSGKIETVITEKVDAVSIRDRKTETVPDGK